MTTIAHTGTRNIGDPALLECEGAPSCGRWTTHEYVKHELLVDKNGDPTAHPGWAVLYRCCGCGTVRRWGTSDSDRFPVVRPEPKPRKARAR